MINVNFTHANDYLALKRGTIGLSGHFFLKWLKSVNVDKGTISTNWFPAWLWTLPSPPLKMWTSGLCWLRPSWFLRIHNRPRSLVKRQRNAGRELQKCAHLPASLCSTPHNPGSLPCCWNQLLLFSRTQSNGFPFPPLYSNGVWFSWALLLTRAFIC